MSLLLSASNITKEFPGVRALKGVDFELRAGEILALCGENGAGKSTLMKILSGLHPAGSYSGDILLEGKPIAFHGTKDSFAAGIAIVYQELSLIPNLRAFENLFLGREQSSFGILDENAMIQETQRSFDALSLTVSPMQFVSELSIGECQLVEIAKALRASPKVLILDEPTSGLSETETKILFGVLRQLAARGIGIIVITHKLNEVFAISDRITVLRDGQTIRSWPSKQVTEPELIESMVGRTVSEQYPPKKTFGADIVLSARNWTVPNPRNRMKNVVENLDFELRRGEILGISGLMGAGRTELLLSLFGAIPHSSGELELFGESLQVDNPQAAIARNLVLLTEDRKQWGLILGDDIVSNITLASLKKHSKLGVLDSSRETDIAKSYKEKLSIRAPSVHAIVQNLSGGNQQKVVLAKCLETSPKVLLMDEPTRGIDVGARHEIYLLIQALADSGMSVILASSEIPELLGVCHRVLVLCEGRGTGDFENATETQILAAATKFARKPIERNRIQP